MKGGEDMDRNCDLARKMAEVAKVAAEASRNKSAETDRAERIARSRARLELLSCLSRSQREAEVRYRDERYIG